MCILHFFGQHVSKSLSLEFVSKNFFGQIVRELQVMPSFI